MHNTGAMQGKQKTTVQVTKTSRWLSPVHLDQCPHLPWYHLTWPVSERTLTRLALVWAISHPCSALDHMMAGKGAIKQLLMICLLSYYRPCFSQCYVNRHLATKPSKDLEYRTDTLSLKDIFISILDYTAIVKEELPVKVGNLSVTHPGDTTCAMLGLGYDLQFLTTEGRSLLNSAQFPSSLT